MKETRWLMSTILSSPRLLPQSRLPFDTARDDLIARRDEARDGKRCSQRTASRDAIQHAKSRRTGWGRYFTKYR